MTPQRPALASTLAGGLSWTVGSLVILALSGIVINLVIAAARDAADLGVFNQAYAVYIVASQLAVLGLHNSVMRHAAHYSNDPQECGRLAGGALVLSLLAGVTACGVLLLLAPVLGSESTVGAIRNVALGLLLFPLSKALLALLNGLQLMKAYAMLQSVRYLVVMAWVSVAAWLAKGIETALLAFVVAEAVTSLAAGAYLLWRRPTGRIQADWTWLGRHLSFGARSLFSNTFVELNSRIDVLLIGHFLGDRQAGVYSFGAILIDGLYQVWHVVRVNFNPILVKALRDNEQARCTALLRKSVRYMYPIATLLALGVFAAYWVAIHWILPGKGLSEGSGALLILLAGMTAVSAFVPFDHLPLAGGHPALQTLQQFSAVVVNLILATVLIPLWGIEGAALATAMSYVAGILVLFVMARRLYAWNLFANRFEA